MRASHRAPNCRADLDRQAADGIRDAVLMVQPAHTPENMVHIALTYLSDEWSAISTSTLSAAASGRWPSGQVARINQLLLGNPDAIDDHEVRLCFWVSRHRLQVVGVNDAHAAALSSARRRCGSSLSA